MLQHLNSVAAVLFRSILDPFGSAECLIKIHKGRATGSFFIWFSPVSGDKTHNLGLNKVTQGNLPTTWIWIQTLWSPLALEICQPLSGAEARIEAEKRPFWWKTIQIFWCGKLHVNICQYREKKCSVTLFHMYLPKPSVLTNGCPDTPVVAQTTMQADTLHALNVLQDTRLNKTSKALMYMRVYIISKHIYIYLYYIYSNIYIYTVYIICYMLTCVDISYLPIFCRIYLSTHLPISLANYLFYLSFNRHIYPCILGWRARSGQQVMAFFIFFYHENMQWKVWTSWHGTGRSLDSDWIPIGWLAQLSCFSWDCRWMEPGPHEGPGQGSWHISWAFQRFQCWGFLSHVQISHNMGLSIHGVIPFTYMTYIPIMTGAFNIF